LAVATALLLSGGNAPAKPLQHAIIAELVARGEPQKKDQLPRRVRTKKRRRKGTQTKRRLEQKKARENANSALKRLESLGTEEDADDALARLGAQNQTGDKPKKAKGRADGSDQGSLSQGELRALADNYLSAVGQAIKADGNYSISETISAAQRIHLEAILFLRIGAGGRLLEVRLDTASGNEQFDRDILAAARAAKYPAPPPEVAAQVAAGVRGTFRP
jgi:TonB family protein